MELDTRKRGGEVGSNTMADYCAQGSLEIDLAEVSMFVSR